MTPIDFSRIERIHQCYHCAGMVRRYNVTIESVQRPVIFNGSYFEWENEQRRYKKETQIYICAVCGRVQGLGYVE